jgi:hypothetical protein
MAASSRQLKTEQKSQQISRSQMRPGNALRIAIWAIHDPLPEQKFRHRDCPGDEHHTRADNEMYRKSGPA